MSSSIDSFSEYSEGGNNNYEKEHARENITIINRITGTNNAVVNGESNGEFSFYNGVENNTNIENNSNSTNVDNVNKQLIMNVYDSNMWYNTENDENLRSRITTYSTNQFKKLKFCIGEGMTSQSGNINPVKKKGELWMQKDMVNLMKRQTY